MLEPKAVGDTHPTDATVAIDGASTRPWLQSADLILGEAPSLATCARWIAEVFARYPGCVVAGARHTGSRWLLVAVRNGQRLEVHASAPGELNRHDLDEAARATYATWIRSSREVFSEMSGRAPNHGEDPS
jgi:hypothetical protein